MVLLLFLLGNLMPPSGPPPNPRPPTYEDVMAAWNNVQASNFGSEHHGLNNLTAQQISAITPNVEPSMIQHLLSRGMMFNLLGINPRELSAGYTSSRQITGVTGPGRMVPLDVMLGMNRNAASSTVNVNPQWGRYATEGISTHELQHARQFDEGRFSSLEAHSSLRERQPYNRMWQQIESDAAMAGGGYNFGPGNFRYLNNMPAALRSRYEGFLRNAPPAKTSSFGKSTKRVLPPKPRSQPRGSK